MIDINYFNNIINKFKKLIVKKISFRNNTTNSTIINRLNHSIYMKEYLSFHKLQESSLTNPYNFDNQNSDQLLDQLWPMKRKNFKQK